MASTSRWRRGNGYRLAVVLGLGLALAATGSASAAVAKALLRLQEQVREVAVRAIPATVCVLNGPGSGSGVIISEDGYVLTASHVSAGARDDTVRLILSDGRQVQAKSLGANRTRDAAILKITDPGPWPHVPMGRSADLKQGDWVIALGHPGGFERGRTPPVRLGRVITTTDGPFGLITDCTVIGGDSGGPLFNLNGEVVGIHSSIAASTTQNRDVPIDVFHRDWDELLKKRRWGKLGQLLVPPGAGYLGVVVEPAADRRGLKVVEVEEDGAAAQAGIAVNDVLLSFDGYLLTNTYSLVESVAARMAGSQVNIRLSRGDKEMSLTVALGSRPGETPGDASDEQSGDELSLPPEVEELLDPFKEEAGPDGKGRTGGTRIPLTTILPPSYFAENGGAPRRDAKPRPFEKKHASVLGGFRSVARRAALSTVGILAHGKPAALGALINREGDVLTKASELRGDLTIRYPDGSLQNCTVVGVDSATDLALLRPEVKGTHGGVPLKWKKEADPVGSLVVTPAPDGTVVAVGVISVATRRPRSSRAFLGIGTDLREGGVTIVQLVPRTAAAQAGLKVGDVLLKIADDLIEEVEDVFTAIGKHAPGDTIEVRVRRGDEELTLKAKLKTPPNMTARRFEQMNSMSGPRSKRRSGFPQIVQHDSEIPPIACGGPLVDLNGKAIGINIARAGRVESDAIPAETIQTILADLQSGKMPPPKNFGRDDEALRKEITRTKSQIRQLQRRLEQLERQLQGN